MSKKKFVAPIGDSDNEMRELLEMMASPDSDSTVIQFKVITTDEVVSQMNQLIDSVSQILNVSLKNNIKKSTK